MVKHALPFFIVYYLCQISSIAVFRFLRKVPVFSGLVFSVSKIHNTLLTGLFLIFLFHVNSFILSVYGEPCRYSQYQNCHLLCLYYCIIHSMPSSMSCHLLLTLLTGSWHTDSFNVTVSPFKMQYIFILFKLNWFIHLYKTLQSTASKFLHLVQGALEGWRKELRR